MLYEMTCYCKAKKIQAHTWKSIHQENTIFKPVFLLFQILLYSL